MRRRGRDDPGRLPGHVHAAEEASRIADEAPRLLGRADGVEWYGRAGSEVDLAAYMLCLLRRARAGEGGGPAHGDEAVREALRQVDASALVWFASRAVSYMDENGFPEDAEPWFADRP